MDFWATTVLVRFWVTGFFGVSGVGFVGGGVFVAARGLNGGPAVFARFVGVTVSSVLSARGGVSGGGRRGVP